MSKKRYRQLKAELARAIHDLGFTYRIIRKPAYWRGFREGFKVFDTRGWIDEYKRKITVVTYGKEGFRHILFVLAHELRHATHIKENLFKSYYGLNNRMMRLYMKGQNVEWKWPNLAVAVRAERDCDRWAATWLRNRDVEYDLGRPYPSHDTASYAMTRRMKAYIKTDEYKHRILKMIVDTGGAT